MAIRFVSRGISFLALFGLLISINVIPSRANEIEIPTNSSPFQLNPLTGQSVADPNILDRRPIAIKISNYPRSVRPQSGLSKADLVYEYYLERGVTRFIGVFYGEDAERAGPIRSARFFDEYIFRMYQAFFVFGNADDRVMDYFLTLGKPIINRFILEMDQDRAINCHPGLIARLCRDGAIPGYQNLFANTAALSQDTILRGIDNSRQDLSGMVFQLASPPGGEPGTMLDLNYSQFIYSRWLFDDVSNQYLRFQDVQDSFTPENRTYTILEDQLTEQAITADNVAVLFVSHSYYTKTNTTEIIEIHLTGFGDAILFRDGKAYPAIWIKPNNGLLSLYSIQGTPLPFKPGTTFFQVMGESSSRSQSQGYWQFDFKIP
jgi:hypothetical protein